MISFLSTDFDGQAPISSTDKPLTTKTPDGEPFPPPRRLRTDDPLSLLHHFYRFLVFLISNMNAS
jgi:hypothetical protein